MNQYDFDLLLQKYLAGECSPEEEQQILEWSEGMLESSRVVMTTSEREQISKRLWKRLARISRPVSRSWGWWPKLGIAASLLLVLGIGASVLWSSSVPTGRVGRLTAAIARPELPSGNIEVKNTSDKPYKMVLEDGTQVTLQPQSSLSHPEHFDEKSRVVHLSGEAFFDVTKNPARPFFVYTGELVTRVLGTSFNIKSYNADKSVEVSVVTGRVSVYENVKRNDQVRNGIILKIGRAHV